MNKFTEIPKDYEELTPLFEAAETASLAAEDVVPYSESEQRLYDEEMARLEYGETMAREAEQKGRQEGIKEGIMEGRKEGILEGIRKIAKKMKENGDPIDYIQSLSGLSPDIIASL